MRDVDHIDGVVAGVRHIVPVRGAMNIGMIEAIVGATGRQIDVAEVTKCHGYEPSMF